MPTLATIANMERYAHVPGLFAYSPATGEQYSANTGDYFDVVDPGWTLTDTEGEPMWLVVRRVEYIDPAELS